MTRLVLLTTLIWAVPFFLSAYLSRPLRMPDEMGFRLFCASLIGMLLWAGAWTAIAAHWIYNHLCY